MKIVNAITRRALLVGVLGVVYYVIYWYSGVLKIPMIGFVGTVLLLGLFDLMEYKSEKSKEKDEENKL